MLAFVSPARSLGFETMSEQPATKPGVKTSMVHFDLGAISEPATKLIECVSKAVGM
jgi:hypothetical protein